MNSFLKFMQFNRRVAAALMGFVLIVLLPQVSAQALGLIVSSSSAAGGGTNFNASYGYINVYIYATIDQPNITAIQFSLTYDPNLLTAYFASQGAATAAWNIASDGSQPGVIPVAMYSLTPLPEGTQQIGILRLGVVNSPVGTGCPLNIPVSLAFNGNNFQTEFNNINVTSSQIIPGSFTLTSAALSPDLSYLQAPSSGSLVTGFGTWTFGPTPIATGDYPVLLNGSQARSKSAVLMLVDNNGQFYTQTSANLWYQWSGSLWKSVSADPRSSGQTAPPLITAQPQSVTVAPGATPSFTVAVAGTSTPTYTWQLSTINGSLFTPIVGAANSSTYSPGSAYTSMNGYQYDVQVSNGTSTSYSNAAILTVLSTPLAPSITAQPSSTAVSSPATAAFTVQASGTPPLSYQWNLNGSAISGANNSTYATPMTLTAGTYNYTVTVSNGAGSVTSAPATLTVNSQQPQTITITASASTGGTITPLGSVSVSYGTDQVFTVIPQAGYTPSVMVDGSPATLSAQNTYTFSDVIAPHTIAVSFSNITYTINASAGTGGTINPSGSVSVNYGASQAFTVTPQAGYAPSLTVDGSPVTLDANNSYTLSNVTAPHAVTASFAALGPSTITASASTGGTITPSGAVSVNYGANQVFTVIPQAGYTPSLTVDGSPATLSAQNTYTFSDVTSSHTIAASFAINTYTINASAGDDGSISPSGPLNFNYGASQTYTITPNADYIINKVLVDNVAVNLASGNTYTFDNVAGNHSISASFYQKLKTISIKRTFSLQ